MNRKIATTIVGVSVLGCLGAFLPSEVWGMDRKCYKALKRRTCEMKEGCEWVVGSRAHCSGKNKKCTNEFSIYNKDLCDMYEVYECKWLPELGMCDDTRLKKGEKKTPKS